MFLLYPEARLTGLTEFQKQQLRDKTSAGVRSLPATEREDILNKILKGVDCTSLASNKRLPNNAHDFIRVKHALGCGDPNYLRMEDFRDAQKRVLELTKKNSILFISWLHVHHNIL